MYFLCYKTILDFLTLGKILPPDDEYTFAKLGRLVEVTPSRPRFFPTRHGGE
jgi:hypothetical protein